jgi:hypothetical protein
MEQLVTKYRKETKERKRLFNLVQGATYLPTR